MSIHILGYCREGFEVDTCLELSSRLKAGPRPIGFSGADHAGYIVSDTIDSKEVEAARVLLPYHNLVFPRQIVWAVPAPAILGDDRVGPLVQCAAQTLAPLSGANAFSELWLETPDTNDGKSLSRLTQKIRPILERGLNRARLLPKGPGARHLPRLHIFFASYEEMWVGFSDLSQSSRWPMGIPRLKLPKEAPSRATLKLEEAFHVFLSEDERKVALSPGMTAVDLGAAPGGWTYQFVRRNIHVTAVDNAEMAPSLVETGLVTHIRADALSFLPESPVDWMVCDVVEQPGRIAELVQRWLHKGLARRMVFNLKLPMKKRWEEVERDLDLIRQSLPRESGKILRARQLYHDRKEVTVYIGPQSAP